MLPLPIDTLIDEFICMNPCTFICALPICIHTCIYIIVLKYVHLETEELIVSQYIIIANFYLDFNTILGKFNKKYHHVKHYLIGR